MNSKIKAYAALEKGKSLQPFEYSPGPLGSEQVEIKVEYCGICHSDLSMLSNEWGFSSYPLIAGHEVVGRVTATGPEAKRVKVGQTGSGSAGIPGSCLYVHELPDRRPQHVRAAERTIVGRPGGFADTGALPLDLGAPMPADVDAVSAGPLFCGGITVFNPIVQFGVRPTHRVGVVGIGGLGHMALQFLNKWGCEVTAFTSSEGKHAEAKRLGAHRTVVSTDSDAIKKMAGSLDFILVTVNAALDWASLIGALAPRGRIHFVGAVLAPVEVAVFGLLVGQKSVSGSPSGSPSVVDQMLAFCGRHQIAPVIERFPMSRVNDALDRLRSGKARYRIVLENDFS